MSLQKQLKSFVKDKALDTGPEDSKDKTEGELQ
jgi:hypothetical protein